MLEFDLENVPLEKSLDLEIPGWKKLTIKHGSHAYSGISWTFWKVEGTDHIFKIQYHLIVLKHNADLKDHFQLTLKTFREDYKTWENQGFPEDWMKKYQRQFQHLII